MLTPPGCPPSARSLDAGPAVARARFVCPGCGLSFQMRRAADPDAPLLRCLPCAFLLTISDTRAREAVRRGMARAGLQRRLGGRDAPPVA